MGRDPAGQRPKVLRWMGREPMATGCGGPAKSRAKPTVRPWLRLGAAPNVASALLQAEGEGADAIVMSSRGLSDLGGLLLGSVTHKVIQLSHSRLDQLPALGPLPAL